jgi:hypothetical protein
MPNLPPGVDNRFASSGSYADALMRDFLKTHTFLVKVNVTSFKDTQFFAQVADIIQRVKPAYTSPVYIWAVPIEPEVIPLNDSGLNVELTRHVCDRPILNCDRFVRDSDNPLYRHCPEFIRGNVPPSVYRLLHSTEEVERQVDGGTVAGYINRDSQWRAPSNYELGWLNAVMRRDNESVRIPKDYVFLHANDIDFSTSYGASEYVQWMPSPNLRIVPIYTTTWNDIKEKLANIGVAIPDAWSFTVGLSFGIETGAVDGDPVNNSAINGGPANSSTLLADNYDVLMSRSSKINYLGHVTPPEGYKTYTPPRDLIQTSDYLLCMGISDITIGVYWVTTNQSGEIPCLFEMDSSEELSVSFSAKISRGFGPASDTTYYMLRGEVPTLSFSSSTSGGIDSFAINSSERITSTAHVAYRGVNITRDSAVTPALLHERKVNFL